MGETETSMGRRPAKALPPHVRTYLEAQRGRIDLAFREFEEARRSGQLATSPLAQRLRASLPPLAGMPQGFRELWGDGNGDYDLAVVAPVAIVAEIAASRPEFKRLLGLYGTGYRGPLRQWWYSPQLASRTTLGLGERQRETYRLYQAIKGLPGGQPLRTTG